MGTPGNLSPTADGTSNYPFYTVISGDSAASTPLQSDRTATSTTIAATNDQVAVSCAGCATVSIAVPAITSGTLQFEHSLDSTTGSDGTWTTQPMYVDSVAGSLAAAVTSATAAGRWVGPCAGKAWVRVRVSATAVAVTADLRASAATFPLVQALPQLIYNSSAPVLTTGQWVGLQGNANGALNTNDVLAPAYEDNPNAVAATAKKPLTVATYCKTLVTNLGSAAALNIKATPGNFYGAYVHNTAATLRYFQVHNTGTTPSASAVPLLTFLVPALSSIQISANLFGDEGVNFSTGIAGANSSAEGVYTAGSAGDLVWHAFFQ